MESNYSGPCCMSDEAIRKHYEEEVKLNKELRRDLDISLQKVHAANPSRERSLAITKIQEAIMWLGMDLKRLGEKNPYPESKDPSSLRIEPTADGLRM